MGPPLILLTSWPARAAGATGAPMQRPELLWDRPAFYQ